MNPEEKQFTMQKETVSQNKLSLNVMWAKLAEKADVSVGTISRVFNNSSLVPAHTRSKVLACARELGFRPRIGVRNKQIALVTEQPHEKVIGCYTHSMTQYICFALSRAGAGISLITEDRLNELTECWFDGMIAVTWQQKAIQILKSIHHLPIVCLNGQYAEFFHTVHINPSENGRQAGKYLWEKGHRKLAVIHEHSWCGFQRMEGIRKQIAEYGVDPDAHLQSYLNDQPLLMAVKQLLEAGSTAVWVTGEDLRSVEVYWLLTEVFRKRIPDDISILAFDYPQVTEFLCPSQTSMCSPLQEMAEKAVELVLRDDPGTPELVEYESRLIERGSVADLTKRNHSTI